jgi:DNA-binding CsgD family transcriptional regulator
VNGGGRPVRLPRPRFGRRRDRTPDPAPVAVPGRQPDADAGDRPAPAPVGVVTVSHSGLLVGMDDGARSVLEAGELAKVTGAVTAGGVAGPADPAAGPRDDGRWLGFHAGPRGGATVDVVVRRIRPHQVSELMVPALGLTPAQWYLLGAVARNRPTQQIAQELAVSAYAVQDDLMALFTAFGVDGRVSLVKALFFGCYLPWHATDVHL